jgi:hypothetical protein
VHRDLVSAQLGAADLIVEAVISSVTEAIEEAAHSSHFIFPPSMTFESISGILFSN